MEELVGAGMMTYSDALKATTSVLQSASWNLLKKYASDETIEKLPIASSRTVAMKHMSGGILLHLQRKVEAKEGPFRRHRRETP